MLTHINYLSFTVSKVLKVKGKTKKSKKEIVESSTIQEEATRVGEPSNTKPPTHIKRLEFSPRKKTGEPTPRNPQPVIASLSPSKKMKVC
jgi:hypothetical protein